MLLIIIKIKYKQNYLSFDLNDINSKEKKRLV